eukprot:753859-Hanusia_phi.AAC.4
MRTRRDKADGRCSKLGGDVHFQMAKMYENGIFSADGSVMLSKSSCDNLENSNGDLESAFFHLSCAAKMGYAKANVILAKVMARCLRGIFENIKRISYQL